MLDLGFDQKSNKLLRQLWLNPGISRSELAELTNLDPSTVSRIMSSLIERGVVEVLEEGQAGPQGGRKPVMLRINPGQGLILGMELQSTSFHLVLINLHGDILSRRGALYQDPHAPLTALFLEAWQAGQTLASLRPEPLLGVGIGIPGIVDSHEGVILRSNPLEIDRAFDLLGAIAPLCPLPIRIENDVRCCCWAELVFHKGKAPNDFCYVLGEFRKNKLRNPGFEGIAMGMGLVLGGKVYEGNNMAAGEFRSVFYDEVRANGQFSIPDNILIQLDHSPEVQDIFARELGRNLALIVNILNLPKVFIGGSIESLGPGLLAALHREIESNWQYPAQGGVDVSFTSLGDDAVAYGASGTILDFLFRE